MGKFGKWVFKGFAVFGLVYAIGTWLFPFKPNDVGGSVIDGGAGLVTDRILCDQITKDRDDMIENKNAAGANVYGETAERKDC